MELFVFISLISLSGFFSSAETAIFSVSKYKMHSLLREKRNGAASLAKLKSNPNKLLSTITISNNLAQILSASLATFIATQAFGSLGIGLATGVITIVITIFGENIPKSLAAHNPVPIALFAAPIVKALGVVTYPVVVVLESISSVFTKAFAGEAAGISEEELKAVIAVSQEAGVLGRDAAEIMENVIEFEDVKVREVMTPEISVVYLNGDSSLKVALPTIIKSDYSRFPVYLGNEENIVGVFDTDVVFRAIQKNFLESKIKDLVLEPFIVPENKKVAELLADFAKNKIEFAVVVDEHGSFVGVVSLDDILEEIVGDIFDKSLKIERLISPSQNGIIEVDAKARISDLEKILHVSLKGEGFTTLAGLIQTQLGRIPKVGEKLKLKNFEIEIQEANNRQIKRVILHKIPSSITSSKVL